MAREKRALTRTACCILPFAFVISCGRTTPAPPPPPPKPAPVAITDPALPSTVDEARQLKTSDPETYQRALKAIATPRALALLGLYQFEQKRWDDAIGSLTQAAEQWPTVAPFLRLRIIEAEQQRGNFGNAINVAQQIIATSGETSAATLARIRLPALYAQAGDATSTDNAYRQIAAMQLDELSEGELVELAARLETSGRRDLATAIRMHLLNDYPQSRFTEKTFAQLEATASSPLDMLSLDDTTALASRLAQRDHYDEALQLLDRAAKRFPDATKSDMYRNVKLRALFNSRHYTELLAETSKNHLDGPQLLLRARAAWRVGDATTFLAGLDQAEDKFPQSKEAVEAKLLRAKYFTTDETNYDAAIQNLNEAIGAGALGNDGETIWTLGWTYVLAGKDDDALRIFDQYLHDYRDGDYRTNSLFWSGKIYAKRGQMSERDSRFAQLIAEYPYSYYAYRAKEITGVGQAPSPVAPVFPDVTPPDLPVVNDLVSIDLMRDATRELKLAAAAHPENLGLAYMLADLYIHAGEPFKANGVLQRRFRDFVRHGGANIPDRFWQILFPLNHWETIKSEAAKRNVDPYLLASIIRQESGFEPSTISNAGAVGLMQIMPAEAEQIATRAGIEGVTRETLFDPDVNIAVGAAEFAQKLETMQGRTIPAIAAYNGGETAVNAWLLKTPADDIDLFVESIPYAETRLYVKTVTRNRNEYRRIYE